MFQPTRDEVRHFFCSAWRLHREGRPASAQERSAIACILEHPEYHDLLDDPQRALSREFPVEGGRENPFLHLSMHLALLEQESIDQPAGIRAVLEALRQRLGERHAAAHQAMECLGEILWRTQRGTLAPDIAIINHEYLDCLQRRLSRAAPG
jgi:hypothetical protein